jgi:DnaD/phage-associated family protein
MTSGFVGFPDVKMRPVKVPDLFFTELAPQIDNLAELKLTLHCLWLLNEQTHEHRFLRGEDLRGDEVLLRSLAGAEELRPPQNVLKDALERAVARNTLLRLEIESGDEKSPHTEDWYFLNTVKGRQTIAMIRQGRIDEIRSALPEEARLRVNRPNVFLLYEQNIGALTPLIADQLRDMERSFAPVWIQDAFEIAVSRNKRNLRYIHNILRRWETEGRDGDRYETVGRDSEVDRRKTYIPDEYSDIIIG